MTTKKKPPASPVRSSTAEYLTFVAASGGGGVEAGYADENVWLSQEMMAQLYGVEVPTINDHLKQVFEDGELDEDSVVRDPRVTTSDGKAHNAKRYSLPATIALGYRLNSERAAQFRKWATRIVAEFTIKGFAMDDDRLARGGSVLGDRYLEEQLQRVREIRLSERKFYQKITDLYATALDYDVTAQATQRFFATVQNKLHWAIHGHTAPEVHECAELSRLVSAHLDFAESMARRKVPMTMQDWETRLNRFLAATDREVLSDPGKVTEEIARAHAQTEFEKYPVAQGRVFENNVGRAVAETTRLAAPSPRTPR